MRIVQSLLAGFLVVLFAGSSSAEMLAVIANKDVLDTELSKSEVQRIFLGKQREWPSGGTISVVAPGNRSVIRSAYINGLLDSSDLSYARYWLKQKQLTGESEPRGLGSDVLTIRHVGRTSGGIGVVAAKSIMPTSNVKVLFKGSF